MVRAHPWIGSILHKRLRAIPELRHTLREKTVPRIAAPESPLRGGSAPIAPIAPFSAQYREPMPCGAMAIDANLRAWI